MGPRIREDNGRARTVPETCPYRGENDVVGTGVHPHPPSLRGWALRWNNGSGAHGYNGWVGGTGGSRAAPTGDQGEGAR